MDDLRKAIENGDLNQVKEKHKNLRKQYGPILSISSYDIRYLIKYSINHRNLESICYFYEYYDFCEFDFHIEFQSAIKLGYVEIIKYILKHYYINLHIFVFYFSLQKKFNAYDIARKYKQFGILKLLFEYQINPVLQQKFKQQVHEQIHTTFYPIFPNDIIQLIETFI